MTTVERIDCYPTGRDRRKQMDDQHGHVIDGTARARHWRGSKPRTGSAPDAAEARSDAPKSFAGSLLVPADMLPPASPPDEDLNGNEQGRAVAAAPRANAAAGDRAPAQNGVHQNPFLVPEAARVEHRSRFTRRRLLEALLVSQRGLISALSRLFRPLRCLVAIPNWLGGLRVARLLMLAALTGAVVVVAVIATRPNAARPSFASALGSTGPVTTPGSGSLTAASNPFAQQTTARDRTASHRVRLVQAHRRVDTHRRPRPARKPAVVPARYTPPSAAGSSAPSAATSSYAGAAPTVAASQPAPSSGGGTTTSSTSGSSRPAFGENGTLGPGHSPNS